MLVGLHVPEISKCTDKTPKSIIGGGGTAPPPLATLMASSAFPPPPFDPPLEYEAKCVHWDSTIGNWNFGIFILLRCSCLYYYFSNILGKQPDNFRFTHRCAIWGVNVFLVQSKCSLCRTKKNEGTTTKSDTATEVLVASSVKERYDTLSHPLQCVLWFIHLQSKSLRHWFSFIQLLLASMELFSMLNELNRPTLT